MRIDIFSDVICPWCFIGKRRLERALREKPQEDLEIHWRAFQLNPDMPIQGMPRQAYLDTKFGNKERATQIYETIRQNGAREDIDFQLDKIQRTPNTVKAHRLIRFASEQGMADPLVERLFTGYFYEGVDIGDADRLADLAEDAGLQRGEVAVFLESSEGTADVLAETRFAYENGINGVPCFIFDRHYALAGAQEPEAFFPLFELARNEAAQKPKAANTA
ncbi:MAG: DsbA family oxidoreductase [Alphaproteobacteria bacterium]|nr:DsbA family oxidoreductase [Alphaproteobacteria bacterium]